MRKLKTEIASLKAAALSASEERERVSKFGDSLAELAAKADLPSIAAIDENGGKPKRKTGAESGRRRRPG